MCADKGEYTVLVLFDLSAAFDTIDHAVLIDRLVNWVRISGPSFKWFSSYLSDRHYVSPSAPLLRWVPHGLILGPILFLLYMLPLGHLLISSSGISYRYYADDMQLYFSVKPYNLNNLTTLHD